jgi:hypothetical protein
LYGYSDIPLKLYIEISEHSDLTKLIKKGRADESVMDAAWEDIVRIHCEENGNLDFLNYRDAYYRYCWLMSQYNLIGACLTKIAFNHKDKKTIQILLDEGYRIDTSNGVEAYYKSITAAQHKAKNIYSKIESKRKELENFNKKDSEGGEVEYFETHKIGTEELVADVAAILGFDVNSNITLAKFNRLNKRAKQKMNNGRNTR